MDEVYLLLARIHKSKGECSPKEIFVVSSQVMPVEETTFDKVEDGNCNGVSHKAGLSYVAFNGCAYSR